MDNIVNIPRLPLNFKTKMIKRFEKENGPIIMALDGEIEKITKIIQAGNNYCDEETADDILDNFLENGGDIDEAIFQIMGALQKKGFLKRSLPIVEIGRKRMQKEEKKMIEDLERGTVEEKEEIVGEQTEIV